MEGVYIMICPTCGIREITKYDIFAVVRVYPRHTKLEISVRCNSCGTHYFADAIQISKDEMKQFFRHYACDYFGRVKLSDYETRLNVLNLTYYYNKMIEKIDNFKGRSPVQKIDIMSLLP